MTNDSDPNALGQMDSWDDEGAATAPPPAPKSSFFTFWRCCGCLVALGVLITFGTTVALKMMLDSFFELTPLEIPAVEFTEEQANEIGDRLGDALRTGEAVQITPEELTVLAQRGLLSDDVKLGAGTRVIFRSTPDGLLEVLLSIQVPEGKGFIFWFIPPGRFVNIRMVGTMEIEDGEFTDAKFAHFKFGPQEGVDFSEAESRELLETLRERMSIDPEMKSALERIKRFRFDGQNIEVQLRKEASSEELSDEPATSAAGDSAAGDPGTGDPATGDPKPPESAEPPVEVEEGGVKPPGGG